ncbi:MAG: GtrA family protein [Elusimicrobia bacterium]|nr:GtrA family protein [Elusimicrobiota bacterium]
MTPSARRARAFASAHARKIRYVAVGLWNTAFGYGAFALLCHLGQKVGVHYLYALAAAQALATTNGYLAHKHFTFKTAGFALLREYLRFSAVYWAIFVVNAFALPQLVRVTGLGPILAQGLFLPFTIVAGYLAHSRFSFASKA